MNENEPETFDFDVFLNHSSKDKPVVRALAERLRADGLEVWFDDWQIRPGDPIFDRVRDGLRRSRVVLLFMSRHGLDSDWATLEHQTILFADPLNRKRRFIPLRLDDGDIPDVLRQFAYLDWRTPTDDAYQKPLAACLPALPGSTSPSPAAPDSADRARSEPERRSGRKRSEPPGPKSVLTGHTGVVRSVAISADGRFAVSGSPTGRCGCGTWRAGLAPPCWKGTRITSMACGDVRRPPRHLGLRRRYGAGVGPG